MDVFYTRSLKFLADKSSLRQSKLRKLCKELLKFLKNEPSVEIHLQTNPDRFIQPFLMALQTTKDSLILKGLFGIQKMLEFQYVKNSRNIEHLITSICAVFDPIQDDSIRISLLKVLMPLVTHLEIHGKLLRDIIKTCFNVYLVSSDVIVQKTAKASLMQILNVIFRRIEIPASRNIVVSPNQRGSKKKLTDGQMIHVFVKRVLQNVIRRHSKFYSESHKDGVVIFNALCRISMKKINPKNQVELKNRILSLELIHSVLRHSGPVFRSSHPFIEDIKRILCISLLQNSVSSIPEVFQQALQIFKTLILFFNKPLKSEIALFFTNCFLPILESQYSSFEHKCLVLDILKDIFARSQITFDLFINYDCSSENNVTPSPTSSTKSSPTTSPSKSSSSSTSPTSKSPQGNTSSPTDPTNKSKLKIVERTIEQISQTIETTPEQVRQNVLTSEQGKTLEHKALSTLSKLLRKLKNFIKADHEKTKEKTKESPSKSVDKNKNKNISTKIESIVRKKSEALDLSEGIKLFNIKPRKGLDYLVKIKMLEDTAEAKAKFVFMNRSSGMSLLPEKIGELLANKNNEMILHKFTELVGLADMEFIPAFRKYLTSFRIPGEGQQIDRILQKFAQVYMEQNPCCENFKTADAAYFFAYATMWLHTDLHNPALKFHARMSIEDFRNVTAGKNEGFDYDRGFLQDVYDNIKSEEIILNTSNSKSKSNSKNEKKDDSSTGSVGYYRTRGKKEDLYHLETVKIFQRTRKEFGAEWKQSNKNKSKQSKRRKTVVGTGNEKETSDTNTTKKRSNTTVVSNTTPLETTKIITSNINNTPIKNNNNPPSPRHQKNTKNTKNKNKSKTNMPRREVFFYTSTDTDKVLIINALFKIMWKNVCSSVSSLLSRLSKNEELIILCLDTLNSGMYVSSKLGLENAEFNFGKILVQNTGLLRDGKRNNNKKNTGVLNFKNVEAIRLVMAVVQKEFVSINSAWIHFLGAISKLDRIRMFGGTESPSLAHVHSISNQYSHVNTVNNKNNNSNINNKSNSSGMNTSFSSPGKSQRKLSFSSSRKKKRSTRLSSSHKSPSEKNKTEMKNHRILFTSSGKKKNATSSSLRHMNSKSVSVRSPSVSNNTSSRTGRKNTFSSSSSSLRGDISSKNKNKNSDSSYGVLDESVLEYVFLNSVRLSDISIVSFVSALAELSLSEISDDTTSSSSSNVRDFCMKKLIDVSVYNIPTRSQAVWTRLWDILSAHFICVSKHRNSHVAILAIDALKQVAFHFFNISEMSSFLFQSKFLLPFYEMMVQTMSRQSEEMGDNARIRLMIVDIIGNLIKLKCSNIKSGWSTIFRILRAAAKDPARDVVKNGFRYCREMLDDETFMKIIGSNLEMNKMHILKNSNNNNIEEMEMEGEEEEEKDKKEILKNHIQFFLSYLDTIVCFGSNTTDYEIGQRSIKLLEVCASKVFSELIPGLEMVEKKYRASNINHLEVWLKIFYSLVSLTHDKHPMEVRIIALEAVFKVLKAYGGVFEGKLWEIIFRGSLMLLFDDMKQVEETGVESDWMKNTCHKSLVLLIDTFVRFYDEISFLFEEILALTKMICRRQSERLCYIGTNCIEKLIEEGGQNFSGVEWKKIVNVISEIIGRMRYRGEEDEEPVEKLVENQKLIFGVIIKLNAKFCSVLNWGEHVVPILRVLEDLRVQILREGQKIELTEILLWCCRIRNTLIFHALFLRDDDDKNKKLKCEEQDGSNEISVRVEKSKGSDVLNDNEISVEFVEKNEDLRSEMEVCFEEEIVYLLQYYIQKNEKSSKDQNEMKMVHEEMKRFLRGVEKEKERYHKFFTRNYHLFCDTFITEDLEVRKLLIQLFKSFRQN